MSFHLISINEIYSNADGSIQFIELLVDTGANGETQLGGKTLTVTQGLVTHTYTFDGHLSGPTSARTILIATQGFADLGLVTPDYIIPDDPEFADGFLFTSGGATVRFAPSNNVDSMSYTTLPTDGITSLSRAGTEQENSPKNFAGETVSLDPENNAPEIANAIADRVAGGGQPLLLQLAANTFSDADSDTLTWTARLDSDAALPAWLSFNATTRTFSGTPTAADAGTLSIRVTVRDPHGGSASDVFSLRVISGQVLEGTAGNDTITGTDLADSLSGGNGNDTLTGGAAADTLDGGANADLLNGGAGADLMRGGLGTDTYVVSAAGDQVLELADGGTDTVQSAVDWTLGANLEWLELRPGATNGTGNALANRLTGNSAANTLRGQNGADSLSGGGGADTLNGAAGADTLNGGDGSDVLAGGAGNDRYVIRDADTASEAADGGIDTVNASIDWTLAANFEKLVLLGTANLRGTGNALANTLDGNGGANTLNGGGGNDELAGGAGNDTLTGGAGADRFVFDGALAANNVNRVTDFQPGIDRLVLPDNIFTAVTAGVSGSLTAAQFVSGEGLAGAQEADDRIIYNTSTGALFYDPDGTGDAVAVRFAVLATQPVIGATDFVVGA